MRPGRGQDCQMDFADWSNSQCSTQSLPRVQQTHKRRSKGAELAPSKKLKAGQSPALSGFLAEVLGERSIEGIQAREELIVQLLSLLPVTPSPFVLPIE